MTSKESGDPLHVSSSLLWGYSLDNTALDAAQVEHLEECERCIGALGVCRQARSLSHAQQLLKEEGFLGE